jgi:hypothetical protein
MSSDAISAVRLVGVAGIRPEAVNISTDGAAGIPTYRNKFTLVTRAYPFSHWHFYRYHLRTTKQKDKLTAGGEVLVTKLLVA